MECKSFPTCRYFHANPEINVEQADKLKEIYCLGDPSACIRKKVAAECGREHVPVTLSPAMHDEGNAFIEEFFK